MTNIKAIISKRIALDSYKELFTILIFSFGFGLGMGTIDDYEIYIIMMTLSIGIAVTCFLFFIIPRIAGMFKKDIDDNSVSKSLSLGRDGEKVMFKKKLTLQDIQF